ncbi:MAG: imidazoleglycerol-phosphate dehydratase HisB [Candidatus Dormibacteria bacterium]
MTERRAQSTRETRETQIVCAVNVDGLGRSTIDLPLPFFRHMVESFVKHSGMDVELSGRGDVEVDTHHLVEDTGLVLGGCVSEALRDRAGIARFGHAYAPLDEALVRCALDYGKRPHVVYEMTGLAGRINDFDVAVLQEFVRGYAQSGGISLHLDLIRGDNLHHMAEAAFKALGLATRQALMVVGDGIPSTKGTL